MKLSNLNLQEIGKHMYLRNDSKYWNTLKESINSETKLSDIFTIINGINFSSNYAFVKTEIPYIRISDLSYKGFISDENMIFLDDEAQIPDNKTLIEGDLVLATIGNTVGKVSMANEFIGGTFSNNTTVLRLIDKTNHIPKFYHYLFQSDYFIKYIFGVVAQKAQPNLQTYDLKNIKIPLFDISTQSKIVKEIETIEPKLFEFKRKILNNTELINKIFGDYFDFKYEEFEKLKTIKLFNLPFNNFSKDVDTRFSVKFHRPSGEYVINELNRVCNKKIKDFISVPIMTGKGISPNDYDENGSYSYASMAEIGSWYFNEENMKSVSDEYVKNNSSKKPKGYKDNYDTTIQKDDILMIRSGEGSIGKVAIVENEVNAIFSDFVIRIRLKDYNPKFAYYYFRTSYFQYLIEIYKKGLGNNTNIFPVVLQEFPIPNISLEEQTKIVKLIDKKISENKIIESKINEKRLEIETIINNYIYN